MQAYRGNGSCNVSDLCFDMLTTVIGRNFIRLDWYAGVVEKQAIAYILVCAAMMSNAA